MKTFRNRALGSSLLLAGAMFSVHGFADELPEQEFTLARVAIEEAQEVNAEAVAGDELLMAESKLQKARTLNEDGEEERAMWLLTESRLHAEHAEVAGMVANAEVSLQELNEALFTLREELGRQ